MEGTVRYHTHFLTKLSTLQYIVFQRISCHTHTLKYNFSEMLNLKKNKDTN